MRKLFSLVVIITICSVFTLFADQNTTWPGETNKRISTIDFCADGSVFFLVYGDDAHAFYIMHDFPGAQKMTAALLLAYQNGKTINYTYSDDGTLHYAQHISIVNP